MVVTLKWKQGRQRGPVKPHSSSLRADPRLPLPPPRPRRGTALLRARGLRPPESLLGNPVSASPRAAVPFSARGGTLRRENGQRRAPSKGQRSPQEGGSATFFFFLPVEAGPTCKRSHPRHQRLRLLTW